MRKKAAKPTAVAVGVPYAQWRAEYDEQLLRHHVEDTRVEQLLERWRERPNDLEAIAAWLASAQISARLVARLIVRAGQLGVSQSQRTAATRKNAANAPMRAWVLREWSKPHGLSKAAFARAVATRLKSEFPASETITPETIRNRWLRTTLEG